ncbi:sugar ABC transporter substrate-binding protein [Serinibacter arcticus]|uniref:Maltose/maltodextrin ABC transporter, substrate binding periplasmic protein MalE n=1 Tax=Serinibacter arcticus TaxID=1655435 RepID=A0A4Z1E1I1_9MICO|nr:maltose ABC transporter substrate-binding protein [Serinibacter arcticus]TGO05079.1 Maltose/maltodextrin ABC transporter, substrate binding periplasmic protein MalE [Serinibacter arcticus]
MRKSLVMIAPLAVAVLALSACGGGDAAPAETATGSASESATESSTGGGDAAGASLTIWSDAEREQAIKDAAADFEADTGATVTVVQKNFEDLRADFLSQVPTGEGPDITIGAHDWLGEFVESGVVDTIDLGDRVNDFEPVTVEALTYDGQLYALPYAQEAVGLIQNTALVGEETPATWDEMIQMATDAGFAERPFILYTAGADGDMYTSYGFQTSFGAPVFQQDESGSYLAEVGLGGQGGLDFAQFLYDNGSAGTGYFTNTVDYDIGNELFASGQSPFIVQGPWTIPTFQDAGVDVAVGPIPSAGPETAAPFVGVQGFYLSAQSSNALLANEFLTNYMSTDEAQQALYEADPRIPALTAVAEEVASDPVIAGFLESAQNGVPMPNIPEMGAVWDFWNPVQIALINGEDPATIWPTMVGNIETALAN